MKTSTITYLSLIGVASLTLMACSPRTALTGGNQQITTPNALPTPTPITQVYGADVNTILVNTPIYVPDTENKIQLTLGSGVQEFQQGVDRGNIMWGDIFVAKQVSDGYDLLAYVNVNHGGSGTQQYLVIYHVTENSKVNTSAIFVGDRIPVQKIEIEEGSSPDEYTAVVSSLTRSPEQAMVEPPTIPNTDRFTISNHQIVGGENY